MHPHQGASLHRRGGQAYTRSMRSVATVGRWSIRHPWLAIVAWLAFVALAILSLAATGTQSLENGSVGESARGYALMDQHQAWPPAREYGYMHSDPLSVGGRVASLTYCTLRPPTPESLATRARGRRSGRECLDRSSCRAGAKSRSVLP